MHEHEGEGVSSLEFGVFGGSQSGYRGERSAFLRQSAYAYEEEHSIWACRALRALSFE